MKHSAWIFGTVFLGVFLATGSTSLVIPQEIVRAKIGIRLKSSGRTTWARTRDTVRTDDLLRIYVVPEESSYVYVIYDDNQTAMLLNAEQYKTKFDQGTLIVLPPGNRFYQTDGSSERESFTIICTPAEIMEVSTLLHSTNASHSKWIALEEELVKRSKIDMNQKLEKPFAVTGSVRNPEGAGSDYPLLTELEIFSGRSFLVKKYAFTVQR